MIRLEAVSAAPVSPAGGSPGAILLRDLDLAFAPGESHLIVGANGSGKTTFLRVLAGLLAPTSGLVLVDGKAVAAPSEGLSSWPDLAILFEEPDPQFLTDRVESEVSFGLESLGLPSEEIRARAAEAMASLGLHGMEAREPQSLSAGEKARTLLAAMLAGRPRALALDQSLAHLDSWARRRIESGLVAAALGGQRVVIRTHQDADPPFPGERLWVLHEGALRDAADWSPDAVLAADRIPFALAMRVSSVLSRHGLWSGPLAIRAESLMAALVARGRSTIGAGYADSADAGISALGSRPDGHSRGRAVLAFDCVGWTPPHGRQPVVRNVAFDVHEGEIVALLGASGSGKTTVLKLAAGLLKATAGRIVKPDERSRKAPPLALEFPERQLFGRTVAEDVAAGLWVRGVPARERVSRARVALSAVGLDPAAFADRVPSSLSEGEKRRTALAGFLVDPAPVLLLDEPTAGLDPEGRRAIQAMLRKVAGAGTAVLFASHDLDFALGVADRAIVIGRDEAGMASILADTWPSALWSESSSARIPGPAPEAVTIGTALRASGYIDPHEELRDSDSVVAALARSLASRSHGPRPRDAASPEATSARG